MPKEEFMDNFLFKDNKFYLLDENNQEVAFISFLIKIMRQSL